MIPLVESFARKLRRHLSDSDLVLYLDGEMHAASRGQVEAHCRSCWSCRHRMSELEHGISDYIDYRQRTIGVIDGGAELRERFLLRLAAEELAAANPRQPGVVSYRFAFALSCIACLLLAAWFVARSIHPPPVSAAALLRTAVIAEKKRPAATPSTGRLRLARLERGEWSTGFLPPSGLGIEGPRFAALENLGSLLREESLTETVALSPSQFEYWAAKLKARLEAERVRIGSEEFWRLNARLPSRESGLQEFSLLLRAKDGVAVEERFHFLCKGERVSFLICAEPFPMPATVATARGSSRTKPEPGIPPDRVPASGDETLRQSSRLAELAIEALYILHETGADLDGTVSVTRGKTSVRVSGVVETSQERDRLAQAFAGQPLISVELVTPQEFTSLPMPARAAISVLPAAEKEQAAFRKSTEQFLRPLVASGVSDEEAYRRIDIFGREAVRLSSLALQKAWALRRLHQDFLPGQIELLPAAHKFLLRDLAEDYHAGAREALQQLATHLRPILPSSPPGRIEDSLTLTALPERIDRLNRILFAGLPAGEQALPSLLVDLAAALEAAPGDILTRQNAWLGPTLGPLGLSSRPSSLERQDP